MTYITTIWDVYNIITISSSAKTAKVSFILCQSSQIRQNPVLRNACYKLNIRIIKVLGGKELIWHFNISPWLSFQLENANGVHNVRIYGSLYEPQNSGSQGGGSGGGLGGGVIRIIVGSILQLDGKLIVNGGNGASGGGGGSGGSVWITVGKGSVAL